MFFNHTTCSVLVLCDEKKDCTVSSNANARLTNARVQQLIGWLVVVQGLESGGGDIGELAELNLAVSASVKYDSSLFTPGSGFRLLTWHFSVAQTRDKSVDQLRSSLHKLVK